MTNAASTATERVALVAGASRGIGADVARAFAAAGYAVVLGARDTDALQHVVDDITAAGGRAVAGATDVGDESSMRALVERAVGTFGRLDAAFNNATDGPMPAPLADIETAEFDRGIRTNVRGTFLGMKYEIPALLSSGGGAIVNMASVAGLRATTNLAAYVAGKAGDHRSHRGRRARLRRPRHSCQRRGARPDPHPPPRAGGCRGAAARRPVRSDGPHRQHCGGR